MNTKNKATPLGSLLYDLYGFCTMTTSPPDISSLTLAPQRLRSAHDAHDPSSYAENSRFQHFQTSPAVVPSPGQRRALPSVCIFYSLLLIFLIFSHVFVRGRHPDPLSRRRG